MSPKEKERNSHWGAHTALPKPLLLHSAIMSVPGQRQQPLVCHDKITTLTNTSSWIYQQLLNYQRARLHVFYKKKSLLTCEEWHWKTSCLARSFMGYPVCYCLSALLSVQCMDYLGASNCIQSLAAVFIGLVSLHSQFLL